VSRLSFEVEDQDLLGRNGRLETKSGIVETPLLFPVINPKVQLLPSREIKQSLRCEAVITNAYLLKKNFGDMPLERGVHALLDFDGVVMTDSGAYQNLLYGRVKISPAEVIHYQEAIGSDIAVILDVPTGWRVSWDYARETVEETLRRGRELFTLKAREDILWVGPVQGGRYIDLIVRSAKAMGELPFDIHALGSPTRIMEQYLFTTLVDMIIAAKTNLPLERPLHLFGAGHPLILPLAVASGCDTFDSAAYAIYARDGRYMTERGTAHLNKLRYFPCSCPLCSRYNPEEVMEMDEEERVRFLEGHNLHVCFSEIRRIKQAIKEGRLWEHLEWKAHGHPALTRALKRLKDYREILEKETPITKKAGLFYFNSIGLNRPEISRYCKRLSERYSTPRNTVVLVLMPQAEGGPYYISAKKQSFLEELNREFGDLNGKVHVCLYKIPFGVVPLELDDVYPLSQYEYVTPPDLETLEYVSNQISTFITQRNYKGAILLLDVKKDQESEYFAENFAKTCRLKGVSCKIQKSENIWGKESLGNLLRDIRDLISRI